MKNRTNRAGIAIGSLICLFGLSAGAAAQVSGAALSDHEISDMEGGPAFRSSPQKPGSKRVQASLSREPVANNGVRATLHNVPYGTHGRNRFDLWTSRSTEPAPLVIFIHGGGFSSGDKSFLYNSAVLVDLLDAGFAVAGINYRYWHQDPRGIPACLDDIARAVRFIRINAEEYGIDKERVGCYGGSAGAVASLWLAFHPDLADPGSADPVLRESTRIVCAGALSTPATLDLLQWPDILGMPALTEEQMRETVLRLGVKHPDDIFSPEADAIRARLDVLGLMSPGDPPFYVLNRDPPGIPNANDNPRMAHHPNHARLLRERADELGVVAVVSAPEIGIIDPAGETLSAFLIRQLSVKP